MDTPLSDPSAAEVVREKCERHIKAAGNLPSRLARQLLALLADEKRLKIEALKEWSEQKQQLAEAQADVKRVTSGALGAAGILDSIAERLEEVGGDRNVWKNIDKLADAQAEVERLRAANALMRGLGERTDRTEAANRALKGNSDELALAVTDYQEHTRDLQRQLTGLREAAWGKLRDDDPLEGQSPELSKARSDILRAALAAQAEVSEQGSASSRAGDEYSERERT